MQIAEVLSDLTSLRVCDPAAALALVSATSSSPSATTTAAETQQPEAAEDKDRDKQDADLQRAKDLLALHAVFKRGSGGGANDGLAAELRGLRAKVAAAVGDIGAASREEEAGGEDEEGFENWD